MKKVFVVVTHGVCDLEDCGVGTQVFSTYDKAKECFESIVSQEKAYIGDCEDWIMTEGNDMFEAYEDGRYSENHTFAQIREQVIE